MQRSFAFLDPHDDPRNEIKRLDWSPSREGWLRIIACDPVPEAELVHIRLRAWWAANDSRRHNGSIQEFTPDDLSNLSALIEMLSPEESLLLAEIHREQGNYDEALNMLKGKPGDSKLSGLVESDARSIRKRAKVGNAHVFELDSQ